MNITQLTDNKKQHIGLLLLADEQESMIERYLERVDMFVLDDNGVKAICVVTGDVPSSVGFYKSCGFEYSHRIENFLQTITTIR